MSRTYRKNSIIEKDGKVRYVKKKLNLNNRFPTPFRKTDYSEEDFAKEYDWFQRDGKLPESTCKTSFKKFCVKQIRIQNRILHHKILRDEEYDNYSFYTDKENKQHIWDFWW